MASAGFLLRKDDYPKGITTAEDVQRLASLLNPYLTEVNSLAANGGVSLSDNFQCEVQLGTFTHGVPQKFTLKQLKNAKGCAILGCNNAIPLALSMQALQVQTSGSLPQVQVTVWFNNPAATGAKVSLLFVPEGQLTTNPAAWIDPILKSLLTTTGDLIFASAPNTPARLGIGAADSYLRSPDGSSAAAWFSNPVLEATTAAGQSIPNATQTIVVYGTVERDTDSAYNSGTGRYTIPNGKGGEYAIAGSFAFGSAASGITFCTIFKNGGPVNRQSAFTGMGANQTISVSATLTLAAGDIIDVRCQQSTGGAASLTTLAAALNYFTLKRLA